MSCILSEFRTDRCSSCDGMCPHKIFMEGLKGGGGAVGQANIPEHFLGTTLSNSPARKDQKETYEFLDDYVKTFNKNTKDVRSLYLYSEEPGTGKTTTSVALINAWISYQYLKSLREGVQPSIDTAYFLDVNKWQSKYNEFNRPKVPEEVSEKAAKEYYGMLEKATEAPFAVLDDIGVRKSSEGFTGDLHTLINERVEQGLATVYTSNLQIEEMEAIFTPRLYDRIRADTIPIHFEGESKRGLL